MSSIDKIDAYLSTKKSSEVSLVFFMIFAFIALVVYMYAFPITEKNLKNTKRLVLDINKKVNQEEAYLRSISVNGDKQFYVKKLQKEIIDEKLKLEETTFANGYVDNKLKELSYLLFNDKNWAGFLNSITIIAKNNDIKISSIANTFTKPNLQKIEQVLNVNVVFSGDFQDIMQFINTLEESQLVVDINDINLQSSHNIQANINIAVWGMKY
ncbi:MAG: type 4a pilus biogenesis protein PilO [Sulfurospirillum sp.]|nr:type 4a pilus biogenesis protein PilO [Sulfurospirillum sp.]